jgi:hypothetical protein
MDAKYITWNFANFTTVNLMVAVLVALVILLLRWSGKSIGAGAAA